MQGRGFLLFVAVTLLLPGAALGVFGARALIQERQLVDQQIRERQETAAGIVSRDLERQFQEWQLALDRLAQAPPAEPLIPPILRTALVEPGAGLLVFLAPRGLTVWPQQNVLYDLNALPPEAAVNDRAKSPALLAAEALEIERRDYAGAIARYRQLLASTPADQRAELLHHLARTYRKIGRHQQALDWFQQLPAAAGFVGGDPSGLIGRFEVCAHWSTKPDRARLAACAMDLYSRLVAGEWQLSKERGDRL